MDPHPTVDFCIFGRARCRGARVLPWLGAGTLLARTGLGEVRAQGS